MNLFDFLLREGAIGNPSARSAIAAKIFSGEISASVTVRPESPRGADTANLIRFALSDQAKAYSASPLNISRFRKILDDMALGDTPDLNALRQIEVDCTDTSAAGKIGDAGMEQAQSDTPPGKEPRVASRKMAIKAAWQIERKTGRAALAKDVITLLQEWACEGKESDTLIKSSEEKRGVIWRTNNGEERLFDVDACGKALESWMKSRQ